MKRLVLLSLAVLLLAGCARGLVIDSRHTSDSQDSRVQYIVLHYTSSGFERSLGTLTRGPVSSHYLIDQSPATVYRLVDENRRAWHAGDSSWQGRTWLNASSIGIELVHPGYTDSPQGRLWHPWEPEQIEALIMLLRDILQRHQLTADRVIGHSDVAPQRKLDPGPLFPWQALAAAGVAVWPQTADVQLHLDHLAGRTPPLAWFADALTRFGYTVSPTTPEGEADPALRNVIAAFQMRFRPARFDGQPDSQTAAVLAALVPAAVASPHWCGPALAPAETDPCRQLPREP
ncbi:N-acetylmuramoyl-L-alanine amidase [Halopseudomonas nanhaiensis]|uniref:N-acetylmuramoyl-L-alanine amidase n=1 Tax=Halopseudomonas nanhaiensis TaxID=2830842 RepID=UPI001CBC7B2A|nr:N-acetylmuramoyl-L-alanine amidase [Halopseudomonas nanhaiensis]UAW98473.1 N-acetylmuramoyl-L-alanine amidase [Halopseudomonas nanhaiensis]